MGVNYVNQISGFGCTCVVLRFVVPKSLILFYALYTRTHSVDGERIKPKRNEEEDIKK